MEGFGYDTTGILEGTIWIKNGVTLGFTKYGVTIIGGYIDFGMNYLYEGTYPCYLEGSTVKIEADNDNSGRGYTFSLNGVMMEYRSSNLGLMPPSLPRDGTLFINGEFRSFPDEIGGIPVVALGEKVLGGMHLKTIVIPDTLTYIGKYNF
jgi:hypothetical protein